MKKKLFITTFMALSLFLGKAQSTQPENSKGIIKIVTVDENGKKTETIKEIDGLDQDQIIELKNQLIEVHEGADELKNVSIFSTEGNNVEVEVETDGDHMVIHKKVKHEGPFLGIHLAKAENGILITKVVEGSGAEEAGLQSNDILTSFNGEETLTHEDLKIAMQDVNVGDEVKLTYLRDGKERKARATLGEYPEKDYERKVIWVQDGNELMFPDDKEAYKIELEELEKKPFLGIKPVEKAQDITGVMIYEVIGGTSAEKLGLQTGDIIYEMNTQPINNFDDLVGVLKEMQPNDPIKVNFKRDGVKKSVSGNLGSKADAHDAMSYKFKDFHFDSDKMVDMNFMIITVSDDELAMLSDKTGHDLKKADKLDNVDVELYPNPSQGKFNVKFQSENSAPVDVRIFNSEGKEVFSENVKSFDGLYQEEIDLNGNSQGAYYLVITQSGKVHTEKIILN
jgi:membrane-associated protease RseP (regulator of RpoE activity)